MWRLAVPQPPPAFCLCSRILLLVFSVFDTSPPLPLPWLPIFHFSDTNLGSSSLMASSFWNYKVLLKKATCKRCKNRETFVDQMSSLLLFQLTRAFLRYRLSEHTVALAFPLKEGILEEVGEGERLKMGVRRPVHKRRSLTRPPSVP